MQCTAMKRKTKRRRDPSFTIHLPNRSLRFNSLGASPLTSPERRILIKSVDLDRSVMAVDGDGGVSFVAE